ncbi:MAG TPA: phosphotransferase family protein [Acidimicrobiia bacterium]|jgi:aminoglycoside phosphotransferase (APT) family kinase protein
MPIPQQRDPEVTREKLKAWLETKLPAVSHLELSELSGPTSTGFSNDTLLFDASWQEAGRPRRQAFVARVKPSGYQIFPEVDVGMQYRCMELLGNHTEVPVPEMWWREDDESVLGAPFFLMGKLEGHIPTDNPPYSLEGFLFDARPEQQEKLWWSGLEAMARVHQVDWEKLGFEFLLRPEHGAPGLEQQLGYQREYFEWAARGKPQPIAEQTWDWLIANRPSTEQVALCWGDARISNQIFRDFRCVAVLDWEMATIADPVMDLAWWIFLDRHFTEPLGVARLPGFPSYDDTIARWEELTGRQAENFEWYEVFAGFRFAVIMMRVAQMLAEFELMPADSDMETNNLVTQLLAKMLDLEPPGDPIGADGFATAD